MNFYQKLSAVNDKNGNPRRLFIVYHINPRRVKPVAIWEEGFAGTPPKLLKMKFLGEDHILVHHYRELVKQAKADGIYHPA